MDLLVVGSIAFDDIKTPFGEEENILGGSATYSSISASQFCDPAVVGVVGNDFPDKHLQLFRDNGINIDGIQKADGQTFHWKGYYEEDMGVAHTVDTQLGVFADFDPQIPDDQRDCDFLFLGNIHPNLQLSVLDQVKDPQLVAMDSMNLWIDTTRAELLQVIKRVDVVFLNDAETRAIGEHYNLNVAAENILKMGPKVIVVKRGENGASVHTQDSRFWAPGVGLTDVFDPTGAGDTFAGGMLGYLHKNGGHSLESLREAVVVGNVLASFTVQQFSVRGLLQASPDEIRKRFLLLQEETTFRELII